MANMSLRWSAEEETAPPHKNPTAGTPGVKVATSSRKRRRGLELEDEDEDEDEDKEAAVTTSHDEEMIETPSRRKGTDLQHAPLQKQEEQARPNPVPVPVKPSMQLENSPTNLMAHIAGNIILSTSENRSFP